MTRTARLGFILLWVFVLTPSVVRAETLEIATWNIEQLRDKMGEGPNARYGETLDADVVAFQEVASVATTTAPEASRQPHLLVTQW
jgi:hypothetical protein